MGLEAVVGMPTTPPEEVATRLADPADGLDILL
jgi:hypothetical protein